MEENTHSDAPQPTAPAPARSGTSVARAVSDTLKLALPALVLLAVLEGGDGLLSNPQYHLSTAARLLFLLSLVAAYLLLGLVLALPQAALTVALRRWFHGAQGWEAGVVLGRVDGLFRRWPRLSTTLLAAASMFLLAGHGIGQRLYQFAIDAQFELPAEAAAVMSWVHLVVLATLAAAAGGAGYGAARLALRWLSPRTAGRLGTGLLLAVLGGLGYVLYTRTFARIVDMRWLAWTCFVLVYLCVQGLMLLLPKAQHPDRSPRSPFMGLLRHRVARLVGLVLLATGVVLGLNAYSGLQLVRFQVHRFGRFAPHVFTALERALDRDGDGHPALLGGLDCDDGDPKRYPGAHDRLSDGHDDNCTAGDPKRPQVLQAWLAQRTAGTLRRGAALPVARQRYNVLLITVDACRPDHLSLYGYRRLTTPNLAVLAKNSLQFTQAHSQGNFTDLALYSLLTGLYPSSFVKGDAIVAGRSLPQYLKELGYDTHAINDLREGRGFFARGFDRFDNSLALRNRAAKGNQTATTSGADITTLAQNFFAGRTPDKPPFFLWLHYADPHGRYVSHPGLHFGITEPDRYDSELAYTDRQIARLLTDARRRGLLKNTVIVVGSDHGEAFGEHGHYTHGHTLYQEELRVPLLVFVPTGRGGGHGRRVDTVVENVDIVPTVLDLVGYSGTVSPMHGESLLDLAFNQRPLRSPGAYAEHRNQGDHSQSLRLGRWKIIYHIRQGFFELYDLAADPRELRNLADDRPRVLAVMKRALGQWTDQWLNGFKTYPTGRR